MTEALSKENQEAEQEADEVPLLTVTPEAAKALKTQMGEDVRAIRLLVQEGGCCGMQYAMTLAKSEPNDIEATVESEGVRFYMDKQILDVMRGSTVQFIESPMGAAFRIDNPNVDGGSCGC